MGEVTTRLRYTGFLTALIICALLLLLRLVYLYVADPERFPVSTVKVVANYQHITRQQLESILSNYQHDSIISLPIARLEADLKNLEWTEQASVQRIWPDTLKITLTEKKPVAIWNNALMTAEGQLFNEGKETTEINLPYLVGPAQQKSDVLQIYQKLSKLLSIYGLQAASLQLRDNQAWDLGLTNGVQLHLGKRDIEKRVLRFCRAYPTVFADKPDQLSSVDLRYARGMAVQWKKNTK